MIIKSFLVEGLDDLIREQSKYVQKSEIVDNLLSTDPDKVLSANQGRVLREMVDSIFPFINSSYDIYVSLDGDDEEGDGTDQNPYRTIHKALTSIPAMSYCQSQYMNIHLMQNETNGASYEIDRTIYIYNFPWLRRIVVNGNGCVLNLNVDESCAINIFTKPMVTFKDCKFNFLSFNKGEPIFTRTVEYEFTEFDNRGNPTKIYYPENRQVVDVAYNERNTVDHFETLGYRVTFNYNNNGIFCGKTTVAIVENPLPKENDKSGFLTEDYTIIRFDYNNNPRKIVYSNGGIVNLFYRPDAQLDYYTLRGYKIKLLYDESGAFIGKVTEQTTSTESASNVETVELDYTSTVDSNGNPLTITYFNGQQVSFTYNDNGTLNTATTLGYRVAFNYNENGAFKGKTLTKVDESAGPVTADVSGILTSIYTCTSFNSNNSPLTIRYDDGQIVKFKYRVDNQINYFETVGFRVKYNYDSDGYFCGQVTSKLTDSASRLDDTNNVLTEDYTYDLVNANHQPIKITYSSGQIVEISYRSSDLQIERFSTDEFTSTLIYNETGALIGKSTEYEEPIAPSDIDRFVTPDYTYTELTDSGKPSKIEYENGLTIDLGYTDSGNIAYTTSSLNGNKTVYDYDENNNMFKKTIEHIVAYGVYVDERSGVLFDNCTFDVQTGMTETVLLDRDSSCFFENCTIDMNRVSIEYFSRCFNSRMSLMNCRFENVLNKLFTIDCASVKLNGTTTVNGRQVEKGDYNISNSLTELAPSCGCDDRNWN